MTFHISRGVAHPLLCFSTATHPPLFGPGPVCLRVLPGSVQRPFAAWSPTPRAPRVKGATVALFNNGNVVVSNTVSGADGSYEILTGATGRFFIVVRREELSPTRNARLLCRPA